MLLAAPAGAQVTIDLQALQALPGHDRPEHRAPSSHRGARRAVPSRRAVARSLPLPPTPPGTATALATPATAAPAAVTPPAVTPPAVIPPEPTPAAHPPARPVPPPAHGPAVAAIGSLPAVPAVPPAPPAPTLAAPPAPAAPPPAAPAAPQSAVVRFAQGQSMVDPAAAQALTALAHTAATSPNATVNVLAYAPADPADPSAARRVSLDRALAVRTALMAGGLPSSRIYLRALGSASGSGTTTTPDRADVTIMGADLPATAQADAGKGKQP